MQGSRSISRAKLGFDTARRAGVFASLAFTLALIAGCGSQSAGISADKAKLLGLNSAAAGELPWADEVASTGPDHLTLALKFVNYTDESGKSVLSADTAKRVVATMNKLYSVCDMHFRAEQFQNVNPKDLGLPYNPSSMSELSEIRGKFDDNSELVIINTGKWDHSGGLGSDGANAWTMMPGQSPSGAVLESTVSDDGNLVAHEIGHYLNLDHVGDKTDMMSPVIYGDSTRIDPDQCATVRATAKDARAGALRT